MANDQVEKVKVKRVNDGNAENIEIESKRIVPGDIIYVPEGYKMPCDAILLNGECIVNEAMLTGEGIPQIKVPLPSNDNTTMIEEFSIENKQQHQYFLFSGTEIMQVRDSSASG